MLEILLSTFLTYLPYATVTAFTPAPNIYFIPARLYQNGCHEGKKVLYSIAAGFLCVKNKKTAFPNENAVFLYAKPFLIVRFILTNKFAVSLQIITHRTFPKRYAIMISCFGNHMTANRRRYGNEKQGQQALHANRNA